MYTTGNCAKNAMKLLSHNGFTQISALAMVFIVADAFAAGSGTEADPWTGSNVTAIMDAGTDTAPAYYLVDGTYWDPSMDMFVGIYGPNNMLSIRNGGSVHSSYERRIGMMSGSSGTVTVSGLGSEWCTSIYSSLFPSLIVGSEGAGTLNIENGGLVTSEWSVVAFITGSSGTVKVTGSGSVWRDSNWLCVGWGDYWGVGDTCTGLLSIENGGSVASLNSDIGYGVGGRGVVTVSGEGSMWLDSNWICVGSSGEGTLSINNKGQAWCIDSAIGYGFDDMYGSSTYGLPTTTGRGSVTVDGADSIWNISRWLCVGGSGTGSLDIEDGGSVENYDCAIGYLDGSEGSVTVAGSGSTWNNSKWLCVGQSGSGSLSIDNGGRVTSVDSAIGWLPGSTGSVTVAGSGSIWSDEKWICVGDFGTGSMSIQDGGSVTNDESDIGFGADGTGSAIVTGSGSIWNIKRLLSVGGSGTGALCIDNGGCVNSVESDIGVFEGGIGSATVTGSGSTWTNTRALIVGLSGTGNLTITDNAVVESELTVGAYSNDNQVVVSNGARLNAAIDSEMMGDYITIGYQGNGNNIRVSGGADVETGLAYIGYGESDNSDAGRDNSVVVTGAGSTWINEHMLFIGLPYGSGNYVVAQNCGLLGVDVDIHINNTDAFTDNHLRLAYGYVAFPGDRVNDITTLIEEGNIQVWDATANNGAGMWVTATLSNITVTYCADDAAANVATSKCTFNGYTTDDMAAVSNVFGGMGGTTIVFGGDMYSDMAWAQPTKFEEGWYESSWYGRLFSDWCLYNDGDEQLCIWHEPDGYQYVDASSTSDAVYLWNINTRSWRYLSKKIYPKVYDYFWGYVYTNYFPWIWDYTMNCWIYVYTDDDAGIDTGYWLYFCTADQSASGYGYASPEGGWWCYTNGEWQWLYYGSALPAVAG